MAKKKDMVGEVIPGDDLSGDFDPLSHPAAQMPIDELERQIDSEWMASRKGRKAPVTLEEFETKGGSLPEEDETPSGPTDAQATDQDVDEGEDEDETAGEDQEEADEDQEEESATEEKPEKKDGPKEAPSSTDDRIAAMERRLELAELEGERNRALADRLKLERDRHAGTAGGLMQKLSALERQAQQQPTFEQDPGAGEIRPTPQPTPAHSDIQQELAEIRGERVQRAVNTAIQEFSNSTAKFFDDLRAKHDQTAVDEFTKELTTAIASEYEEVKDLLAGNNPNVALKAMQSVMKTAFADTRISFLRKQETAARARAQEANGKLRKKKKASAITKSKAGGKPSKRKAIDPMTASLDELERSINKDFGVHEGAGTELI